MIRKTIKLLLLITLIYSVPALAKNTITDYHPTFIPCYKANGNALRIAIRMYYLDNIPYYLVVDPMTFATETAPVTDFKPRKADDNTPTPTSFTLQELSATPYIKALTQYTSPPYNPENYGLTQANHPVNGMFLTVDMDPSIKPYEANFFDTLVAMSRQSQQPLPVAIGITGTWIIGHPQEFNWLLKQQMRNHLQITWVNHSFSHVYYSDLPMANNFLVMPQTNTTAEILDTEKLLIQRSQLPSVFFRFPGLVANENLILKLRKYGLIPVSSNAWLARNETAKVGSVILVQGNGNEPEGIQKLLPLLANTDNHWLPLNQALSQ